jgi:hypothetical protein
LILILCGNDPRNMIKPGVKRESKTIFCWNFTKMFWWEYVTGKKYDSWLEKSEKSFIPQTLKQGLQEDTFGDLNHARTVPCVWVLFKWLQTSETFRAVLLSTKR